MVYHTWSREFPRPHNTEHPDISMLKQKNFMTFTIVCIISLLPGSGRSQDAKNMLERVGITVTGECLTKVVQDRGRVSLGSTSLAKNPKDASEQAIKSHEALKRRVKELQLRDFVSNTANYQVFEECSYHENKRLCQGYRARITTEFETSEIARLGDIIAVGSSLGSEEISDLQTFASPELLKRSREECLEIATQNAATKAQKLAHGAGVKLGSPVAIQESSSGESVHPLYTRQRMLAAAESSGPSIESRPLDLQVAVTVTYRFD